MCTQAPSPLLVCIHIHVAMTFVIMLAIRSVLQNSLFQCIKFVHLYFSVSSPADGSKVFSSTCNSCR